SRFVCGWRDALRQILRCIRDEVPASSDLLDWRRVGYLLISWKFPAIDLYPSRLATLSCWVVCGLLALLAGLYITFEQVDYVVLMSNLIGSS
ncbi:hypothetical protein HAX54_001215, partial [Datura stramonium]|nr:hypothetical protein [Datura stramonium]